MFIAPASGLFVGYFGVFGSRHDVLKLIDDIRRGF